VNVIESSLITRKPNIIDKIDQSNYDNEFALWRPSPITKLPYIIHGLELQSQIQATGKRGISGLEIKFVQDNS
jgi:hypothetical protein